MNLVVYKFTWGSKRKNKCKGDFILKKQLRHELLYLFLQRITTSLTKQGIIIMLI